MIYFKSKSSGPTQGFKGQDEINYTDNVMAQFP